MCKLYLRLLVHRTVAACLKLLKVQCTLMYRAFEYQEHSQATAIYWVLSKNADPQLAPVDDTRETGSFQELQFSNTGNGSMMERSSTSYSLGGTNERGAAETLGKTRDWMDGWRWPQTYLRLFLNEMGRREDYMCHYDILWTIIQRSSAPTYRADGTRIVIFAGSWSEGWISSPSLA